MSYDDKHSVVVHQLHEFIKYVSSEHSSKDIIFRGQIIDKDLMPKLARETLIKQNVKAIEQIMFHEFKRQAPLYLDSIPDNSWEWLALAQHHGMATRYLDWTTNPLVALWFAVENPHPISEGSGGYGVVWVMRDTVAHVVRNPDEEDPFDLAKTKIYNPKFVSRRIRSQSGCFTVHRFVPSHLPEEEFDRRAQVESGSFVAINHDEDYQNKLIKVKIPAESFFGIRQELGRCSFNAASMYADIDGLARHILWQNTLMKDEKKALDDEVASQTMAQNPDIHILRRID